MASACPQCLCQTQRFLDPCNCEWNERVECCTAKVKHFALQVETIPVNSSLDTTADGDNPPEILSNFNARNSTAADFKL